MIKCAEYRKIPGFDGEYLISNTGIVYSKKKNRIMKDRVSRYGYRTIRLYRDGSVKEYRVHRLVAITYLPNGSKLPFINHKDCNKLNNSVKNLEWCTPRENTVHFWKSGKRTPLRGEKSVQAKLKNEDAVFIRELYKTGLISHRCLAKQYQVSSALICFILNNKTYQYA